MKKIFTILLMMPLLWACSSSDDDNKGGISDELLGTWNSTRAYIDVEINEKDIEDKVKREWSNEDGDISLEFKNNGKVYFTDLEDDFKESASYYVSGNKLVLSADGHKATCSFNIKNNTLTTQEDVKEDVLEDLKYEGVDVSNIKIKKAVLYNEYRRL